MDKQELLQELSAKVQSGEICNSELQSLMITKPKEITKKRKSHHVSVTTILYYIGTAIVVIGIIIYIAQIWDNIGSFSRIVVTLGLGLLSSGLGSMLLKKEPNKKLGSIFHFIGGILIPIGALVTLSEFKIENPTILPVAITFGFIFGYYLLLDYIHKNTILTFFAIANGTAFVYLLFEAILDGTFGNHEDLYAYLTMIVGISYLLLAHSFKKRRNEPLVDLLCIFGSLGFLGATVSQVFDSGFWKLLFFLLVAGGMYLSVYMKNKGILIASTLFLIIHICYITGKYFANSLGWSLALIVLGFVFIGLAYTSIKINKKYINN
ncbi:MAG: DUF2157 domain-containing protein [Candidatus Peribacteraceae bacterium]|nr:DUF2157 domain-containing protein [Candidatus Peribacteraceae bacterium]